MTFCTELVCDSCGAAFSTDQPILLCRQCGGLLDAHYDYAAIKSALRLDDILQRRPTVWRWREFLPVRDARHHVDIGAGGSPLIPCPRLAEWVGAAWLHVKYDGMQPTASLKDRSFAVAVSKATELSVRDVITYSSGNAAASLAAHTSRAGMRGLILVNAWAEDVKLLFLSSFSLPVVRLNWSSFQEVEALMAHDLKRIGIHDQIMVRADRDQLVTDAKGELEPMPPNRCILTTVGRIIFNDMLPEKMPYYNCALSQKGLVRVVGDCHQTLGRAATIDLLDSIKDLGFRYSTLAGLSFGVNDMRVPRDKQRIISPGVGG